MKVLLLSFALLGGFAQAGSPAFYRFTDASGVTQLSDKIPPQAAKSGYEILDSRLFVIEVVPPEPTAQELAARARAEAARLAALRQAELDRELLSRFPSVADVEQAKQSDLQRLELQHDILSRQADMHERNLGQLKRQAAREERNGEVSPATLNALTEAELQLLGARNRAGEKRREIETLTAEYSRKKLRVAALTAQVN